tara:strand:- start:207 stop:419 length:213 start_codon:yes stop_codon:yes gene_type:complete
MEERHLVAFTRVVFLESKFTNRVCPAYNSTSIWKNCEINLERVSVPQNVRAVGRRKTQARLQKDKIQYTR